MVRSGFFFQENISLFQMSIDNINILYRLFDRSTLTCIFTKNNKLTRFINEVFNKGANSFGCYIVSCLPI